MSKVAEIAERDGDWTCHYCGAELASITHTPERVVLRDDHYICVEGYTFVTVDHVIPVSRGGSHDLDNLVLACHNCNSRKGVKSYEEFTAV